MKFYIQIYLLLSSLCMLYVFLALAWEDYDRCIRKSSKWNNEKFGPHYMNWGMTLAHISLAAPIINLLTLLMLLRYWHWYFFLKKKEDMDMAARSARYNDK